MNNEQKEQEWRKEWEDYSPSERKFNYSLLGGLIGVAIGLLLGFTLFTGSADRSSYLINVYTSVLSTIATVGILNKLDARRVEQQHRLELIRALGSRISEIAIRASEELRFNGWLEDGSLRGCFLFKANLHQANLRFANLQGTNLHSANLNEVDLSFANLSEARLILAKLQRAKIGTGGIGPHEIDKSKKAYWLKIRKKATLKGADLNSADLTEAIIYGVDLESADLRNSKLIGADLRGTNLRNANLSGSNLTNAILEHAEFNEFTILPDSPSSSDINPLTWTPDTDMTRYTDPQHPNFWLSGAG